MTADAVWYGITAACSLGAFACGWALGRRGGRIARWAAAIGLGLVIAKTVLVWKPHWEAALFPFVDYAYFQSYWRWLVALLFFGLATPQLPVAWNRAVVAMLAAGVFAWGLWDERWMIAPPSEGAPVAADARHHCPQSTGFTCVPASCVMVLSYWGIPTTEREMATLCCTRETGTTTFNGYRGLTLKAGDHGLRARIRLFAADELPRDGTPLLWTDGYHARVLLVSDGRWIVHDPLANEPWVWPAAQVQEFLAGPVVLLEAS
ncbi:MAG: hypothetical protein H0W72_09115, partial [Planctomycetes bacterium]|nr:hypothetical protein [Planctomycetota bacterium]